MMNTTIKRKSLGIIQALSDIFTLQAQTNYQHLASHSSHDLMLKTHKKLLNKCSEH